MCDTTAAMHDTTAATCDTTAAMHDTTAAMCDTTAAMHDTTAPMLAVTLICSVGDARISQHDHGFT